MAVSDWLERFGASVPGSPESSAPAISFGTGLLLLIIGVVVVAVVVYFLYNKRAFKSTIIKMGEVGGIEQETGIDRAKEIILPFTTVKAIYLQKHKIFLPRPSISVAPNKYLYHIRPDGEWVNIGYQNFNKELKRLNLYADHSDMRLANASLKKLIDKSYKRSNFLKEYAPYIAFGMLMILLGVLGYINVTESAKVSGGVAGNLDALRGITENLERILEGVDSISTTSGVTTG